MNIVLTRKIRNGRRVAIAAAVCLIAASASGQQSAVPGATALEAEEVVVRQYSVELIVFEYVDSASTGSEIFDPDEPPATAPVDEFYFGDAPRNPFDPLVADSALTEEGAPAFGDPGETLPSYEDVALEVIPTYEQAGLKILGPGDYVLNDEYERLERLDAYRPLMRAAWIQPTLEKDETKPITLRRLGNPPLRLDGTVTLYLSRFLHLVVDLALEDESPQRMTSSDDRNRRFGDQRSRFSFDSSYVASPTYYRIEEDRIVRNGELRYYDHPKFGVLAKITRFEEVEPTGDDTGDLLPGEN